MTSGRAGTLMGNRSSHTWIHLCFRAPKPRSRDVCLGRYNISIYKYNSLMPPLSNGGDFNWLTAPIKS
uniref:Uncharacterized protein n=1 Tax=Coturnix japonica TaxID=93934 RepID=A0A8C2UBP1_COTJA